MPTVVASAGDMVAQKHMYLVRIEQPLNGQALS